MVANETGGPAAAAGDLSHVVITKLVLADGTEYTLAPVTLALMAEAEEKLGVPYEDIMQTSKPKAKLMTYLIWLRLRANYPGLTEQRVAELVTLDILVDLNKAG